jgi:predicted PurR-regulated permease PerM
MMLPRREDCDNNRMLGYEPRAGRAAWTVFLVGLMIYLAYALGVIWLVFVAAVLLAYLLAPVVRLAERAFPQRVPRLVPLTLTFIVFLAVLAFGVTFIGTEVASQARTLGGRLQVYVQQYQAGQPLPLPASLEPMRQQIEEWAQEELTQLAASIGPFLQGLGNRAVSVVSGVVYVVLAPILAFFFLKDGDKMREAGLRLMADAGDKRRAMVEDIANDVNLLLAVYVRSLVILSLCTFVSYALALSVMQVPYALLLATQGAVLEFIPVLGPLSAAVITVSVAGMTGYPHLLWVVVFFAAYRLFLDYVLLPLVMGTGLEMHPLLIIFGVFAGEKIGGVPGMFLSIPVMASLRVIYVRWRKSRRPDIRQVSPL